MIEFFKYLTLIGVMWFCWSMLGLDASTMEKETPGALVLLAGLALLFWVSAKTFKKGEKELEDAAASETPFSIEDQGKADETVGVLGMLIGLGLLAMAISMALEMAP